MAVASERTVALSGLASRMNAAWDRLDGLAANASDREERARLRAKRDGVALAQSYVIEALNESMSTAPASCELCENGAEDHMGPCVPPAESDDYRRGWRDAMRQEHPPHDASPSRGLTRRPKRPTSIPAGEGA